MYCPECGKQTKSQGDDAVLRNFYHCDNCDVYWQYIGDTSQAAYYCLTPDYYRRKMLIGSLGF